MIFSSTCNLSTPAAIIILAPLSWPFVLCFSCRLATWMYRLYLAALVFMVVAATCLPNRDAVADVCRYSVPPDFDTDLLEQDERGAVVFKSSEHVSVAVAKQAKT
ncbi:hypothetical protein V5799_023330 [Amblyomma americanum]|uniref:Uncharacterized protein n=1 Tax=Amblyomma americanum TaxID=6943 RepID=A0AAQ4FHY1_AMBAM